MGGPNAIRIVFARAAKWIIEKFAQPTLAGLGAQSMNDFVLFEQSEVVVEDYNFEKTNPRAVFLMAMAASVVCVLGVAGMHEAMLGAIESGVLAEPPMLQPLVRSPV